MVVPIWPVLITLGGFLPWLRVDFRSFVVGSGVLYYKIFASTAVVAYL